jgi:ribonuclease P protein component
MLSRKNRATQKDILSLKVGGKRIHSQSLSFHYKKLTQKDEPKISCAVSKKTERLAVKRNKMKRRCREAVRVELSSVKTPVLGVISFKKVKERISYQKILEEVREIFSTIT